MEMPAEIFRTIKDLYADRSVCVTGGTGFIGGHIVDTLVAAGARVSVIDDLSNSTLDRISDHIELQPDSVRFVYGSILDDRALHDAIDGSQIVIHLAAMGSVPRSMVEPARTFEVNAAGTLRVLESARRHHVSRVVIAASSSAYGNPATLPCVESMPTSPASPYAASKIACEQLAIAWSQAFGLQAACLRYFNIFGPRQRADSAYAAVVAAFATKLLGGERPVIFGDGLQSRDFTFISNAVYATLLAGVSQRELRGDAMNIGTGSAVSLIELAEIMSEILTGQPVEPVFSEARQGDVRDSRADIAKAADLIGYRPIASLRDGLVQTCAWYRSTVGANG